MKPALRASLVACAALAIGASRFVLRARTPDDYDAVGFVLAVDDFDLARFQPHFPGYPVYVALTKVLHLVARAPLDAAVGVSAIAASVTAFGLWRLLRNAVSERAAWCAIGLYAGAALPWITGGAALSDGTAIALCALAFAALSEQRILLGGFFIALMLGARASYFPLALSWLALCALGHRSMPRALFGVAVGFATWSIPFAIAVGAPRICALGVAHLRGHFGEWGGSIVTRPDVRHRWYCFMRDLFFDGLAPQAWALVALAIVVGLASFRRARRMPRHAALVAVVVSAPYALWAFFAQNIVEQPRHLLPMVVLLTLALGCLLAEQLYLAVVAIVVVFIASAPVAMAHARTSPPAAQAAEYLATRFPAANEVAVFGGRSIRHFPLVAPRVRARQRTWLSEVDVDLERLDVFPAHTFITSEVTADPRRAARLIAGPTFCRAVVLDRRQPCLQLFEYDIARSVAP